MVEIRVLPTPQFRADSSGTSNVQLTAFMIYGEAIEKELSISIVREAYYSLNKSEFWIEGKSA